MLLNPAESLRSLSDARRTLEKLREEMQQNKERASSMSLHYRYAEMMRSEEARLTICDDSTNFSHILKITGILPSSR